jgi:CRISPR/Cas system-associated exonuclease Cas4 (RecB family)
VARTELAFGPDPDSEGEVELEVAGGRLRMRGRVDRLDDLGGGRLRVVDYKTGRARGYHPAVPYDGGRRLQHLLYALAVERLRPGERVESAEYHFPTTRGENRVVGYGRATLEAGHQILSVLLDMARQGRFLATTDPADCRYCDFRDVCRVHVDDWGNANSPRALWAGDNAPAHPEYASLVRLRGDEGGDA